MKRVIWDTQTNCVYLLEESTNLIDWTLAKTFVADSTNAIHFSFDSDTRFYRVALNDPRIQFPDWVDIVEEFAQFQAWTSITGTYHMELYADGDLVFATDDSVPAGGFIGVHDGTYDPNTWPYAGFYDVNEWEFRATVTPAAPGSTPAHATVKKKGRAGPLLNRGITAQQFGAFTSATGIQDEITGYIYDYFLANLQAARQFSLNDVELGELTIPEAVPQLRNPTEWALLRGLLSPAFPGLPKNYFHYFGHGGRTRIGYSPATKPGEEITQAWLKTSALTNWPMFYVILDGCRTAEKPDLLEAFVGMRKVQSREWFRGKGLWPRFGAGWDRSKGVDFVSQGTLVYAHFEFWLDYYNRLTHRDSVSGLMDRTYKQAYDFARDPNYLGVNQYRSHNSESDGFVPVGCYECFFDE